MKPDVTIRLEHKAAKKLIEAMGKGTFDKLTPAQELLFGNYEDGRYAWFFENMKRFDAPIPAKGNRML